MKKQIPLNILTNVLSTLVSILVSLFVAPLVIENLGQSGYMFIPLSNNFISYVSIVTIAFTSMSTRFLTHSLYKESVNDQKTIYSTTHFINQLLSLSSLFIAIIALYGIDKVINVPVFLVNDVRILFFLVFVSFSITLSFSVYSVASFARNRLDIASIVNIIGVILRAVIIISLFTILEPRVYFIGLASLLSVIVQSLFNAIISRKLIPEIKFSFRFVKFRTMLILFKSGVWNSFNQLSAVLLTGLDLFIANAYFDPNVTGLLAISKTIPMTLQAFIVLVPNSFNPHLNIVFASSSKEVFINELKKTLRFSSAIIGVPLAVFFVVIGDFYSLWVPQVDTSQLIILTYLVSISIVTGFAIIPLIFVFSIMNKLKLPSIAIFVSGLTNIFFMVILANYHLLDIWVVAGLSGIIEIVRCLIFIPTYASRLLESKVSLIYGEIFRSISFFLILVILFGIITKLFLIGTWIDLVLLVSVLGFIGLLFAYIIMTNKDEKTILMHVFLKRLGSVRI